MRSRAKTFWTLVPLVLGALAMLFPLWWMLVVSLETPGRAGAATVNVDAIKLWPEQAQWSNYPDALAEVGTTRWEEVNSRL